MEILFLAKKLNSASYIFYKNSFLRLKEIDSKINISFQSIEDKIDYKLFDYVFFMGGAIDSVNAKNVNPNIKCVVVDSRSGHNDILHNVDLLISNGLENYLFNLSSNYKNFIYPTYPEIINNEKKNINNSKISIGYHGNKIHLETMFPRITNSLKNISKEYLIELKVMYNIKDLGKSKVICSEKLGFEVKHIQYSYENYNQLYNCDIGLVPQLIPTYDNIFSRFITTRSLNKFNQAKDDYIMRFKDTTNLGRHFIFFQMGVPVISDMVPSSMTFIINEVNGFLAYSSENWYYYLKLLIDNPSLRQKISDKAFKKWKENFSHDILNQKLLKLLYNIKNNE